MDDNNTGNQYFVEENYSKAIDKYTNAIGKLIGKNQFLPLFGRAQARLILNDINNAIDDLGQCVSIDNEHQLSNYYLGYHLMKSNPNDLEKMKKAHRYLLQTTKGSLKQRRFEAALKECTQLIEKLEHKAQITQNKHNDEKSQDVNNKNTNIDNSNKLPPIRDNWYQTADDIAYTFYVKGLTKENVNMTFLPKQMVCQLKLPNGNEYTRTLSLLHEIVPEKCKFSVNEFKISITLIKKIRGDWQSVEENVSNTDNNLSTPWTTKRNWRSLDKQFKDEIETEKPQGDEALNQLFQKIYSDADDDQRRAMIKSFQTSGGTVLSTNWGDVKSKDYEGKDKVLPTGQDVQKYEY